MSRNDVTGDSLVSKSTTDAYRDGHELIWGKKETAPFKCVFCGRPSWYAPEDQTPPPDYCHESDHGTPA